MVSPTDLLPSFNLLLAALYLPTVAHPLEITPNLLIAFYESLLKSRLPIPIHDRLDNSDSARLRNIKLLIGTAAVDVLNVDLSHIDPVAVVNRNPTAILDLVQVLVGVGRLLRPPNRPPSASVQTRQSYFSNSDPSPSPEQHPHSTPSINESYFSVTTSSGDSTLEDVSIHLPIAGKTTPRPKKISTPRIQRETPRKPSVKDTGTQTFVSGYKIRPQDVALPTTPRKAKSKPQTPRKKRMRSIAIQTCTSSPPSCTGLSYTSSSSREQWSTDEETPRAVRTRRILVKTPKKTPVRPRTALLLKKSLGLAPRKTPKKTPQRTRQHSVYSSESSISIPAYYLSSTSEKSTPDTVKRAFRVDSPYTAALRRRREQAIQEIRHHHTIKKTLPRYSLFRRKQIHGKDSGDRSESDITYTSEDLSALLSSSDLEGRLQKIKIWSRLEEDKQRGLLKELVGPQSRRY
ncbi:Centrosomal protein [Neolecta irregularis DAH-3]|uniref:Centrosomal protein n=1 Tax=Neolecta irregularis (strain DAH-3) TaxID=1198029 RepID=A0A1U7LR46_NEOID|nr:Centrosomal protein [Neolecta irregularis DAH-3]|eukprot:OLL25135.1 Centrosomal protein [Neolecta irregularis DAH-3]